MIQGDAEIVRMLLERRRRSRHPGGARPVSSGPGRRSRQHRGRTRFLLEAGADPNGPGIAELAKRSGNADILRLLEAGALTAEALLSLAELGLNALGNIDTFIEGMLCIFTLGLGC